MACSWRGLLLAFLLRGLLRAIGAQTTRQLVCWSGGRAGPYIRVRSSPAGDVVYAAEVPPKADRIATAPRTENECQARPEHLQQRATAPRRKSHSCVPPEQTRATATEVLGLAHSSVSRIV